MNRTNIGWCIHSWNPITGCKNHCIFKTPDGSEDGCYAERITKRFPKHYPNGFEPTFYPKRLGEPAALKKPSMIFVGSMGELFGSWVPEEWIVEIFEVCRQAPQHTFQFLTKFPEGMVRWIFPENSWCGVSATCYDDMWRVWGVKDSKAKVKFVSFEPCLERIHLDPDAPGLQGIMEGIDWVIFGGLSGARPWHIDRESLEKMENEVLAQGIPIFEKENLGLNRPLIQQWPRETVA